MNEIPTERSVYPASVPWSGGTSAIDRVWAEGYAAGVSGRLSSRLRHLAPVAVVTAVLVLCFEIAFGQHGGNGLTRDLLRVPAATGLLVLLFVLVVGSPLWLMLGTVFVWRTIVHR